VSTADDILDQIDQALGDYDIGPDAMRCAPDQKPPTRHLPVNLSPGPREILIRRLVERHGLTRMTARQAVLAAERGGDGERADLVRAEVRAAVAEISDNMRAAMQPMAEAVTAFFKQLGESLAQLRAAIAQVDGYQHAPEAVGCNGCGKPLPPRDRPAWQSRYGPAHRRRQWR
jgi:hypothetical protein